MVLPTNIDSSYADDGSDASVAAHQQHHDTIHAAVNAAAGGTTGQVWAKTSSADYAQAWITAPWGGGDFFRSGYYSHGVPVAGTFGSLTLNVNTVRYKPFFVPVRRAFDRIGVNVATAGGAGAVARMGLYNSSGGKPSTLIVDAGTISTTSTGAKEITISQTLDAGLYYVAIVGQTASCVVSAYAPLVPEYQPVTATPSAGNEAMALVEGSITGALPSTATPLDPSAGSTCPAVQLRAA